MPKILGIAIQTLVDQVGGTYLCSPVIDITFDRKLAEFLGQHYNWQSVCLSSRTLLCGAVCLDI